MRHGARGLRPAAHLNDDRLAEILPGQRLDFGRHRGAEEQRLPVARDLADDAVDLRREPHVEHAVGFVQHEHLEIVEHHVLPLEVIDQATGRRDDDVDAGAQLLLLRLDRHAAVHRHDAQCGVSRVLVHAFFHLDAQLARRREHQRARPLRTAEESIDDWKRERGGLAGSRLREPHDVPPLEYQRNGIRLNRGRRLIARVGDCFQHFTRESDLLECRRFGLRHLLHFSCLDFHDTHRCAPGPRTQDHPGTGVSHSCRRAEGAPAKSAKHRLRYHEGRCGPRIYCASPPTVRDRPGGSHQSDPCREN